MNETILNIYIEINDGYVVGFKAKSYLSDEGDNEKIAFLKEHVESDYKNSFHFDAPVNKKNEFMKYTSFSKLEKHGMHFQLFEEIFQKFSVPENPLICVTPVIDGKIISN